MKRSDESPPKGEALARLVQVLRIYRDQRLAEWMRALPTYERIARCVLNRHRLSVPPDTAKMLAKTIRKHREPSLPPNEPPGRGNLEKARAAAKRLLKYTESRVSHCSSIPTQCAKLHAALHNPVACVSLALCEPRVDLAQLSSELLVTENIPLKKQVELIRHAKDGLTGLVQGLGWMLSTRGKPAGPRPDTVLRDIVRGGCIVWGRSGRSESYNNWEKIEEDVPSDEQGNSVTPALRGPLTDFLRTLLAWCKVEVEDVTLHSAIKAARADPTIQRLAKRGQAGAS